MHDRHDSDVRARLAADASASLDWVTANLPRFTPDLDHLSTTLGTFGELAILYAYAEAWRSALADDLPLDRQLRAWRRLIVSQCQAQGYVESARKQLCIAYAFVLPYLMLRTTGYRSSEYERLLRRMQWWGYPAESEAVPYRVLDREFFLWKGGYRAAEPNWYSRYWATTPGMRCSPVFLDLESAYSVIAVSRPETLPEEASQRRGWAELLGALAVSYARSGDVAVVAVLVRAAAHLELADPWLDEAQAYLLDQQAPAGHFGLLAREFAHLPPNTGSPEEVYVRLTIEVLWAISALVVRPLRNADGGEDMDMRQTAA